MSIFKYSVTKTPITHWRLFNLQIIAKMVTDTIIVKGGKQI